MFGGSLLLVATAMMMIIMMMMVLLLLMMMIMGVNNDTVSEFHAEAPQATASEELAQGLHVADRARFESMTLQTKGDEFTNEPPHPTPCYVAPHSIAPL